MASSQSKHPAAVAIELPANPSRNAVVREGYLPVSEFAADRSGAAAPWGDDLPVPIPAGMLTYVHPDDHATASHH
jgi:hypothetical protein